MPASLVEIDGDLWAEISGPGGRRVQITKSSHGGKERPKCRICGVGPDGTCATCGTFHGDGPNAGLPAEPALADDIADDFPTTKAALLEALGEDPVRDRASFAKAELLTLAQLVVGDLRQLRNERDRHRDRLNALGCLGPQPSGTHQRGWECPRCHVIHAPYVPRCRCPPP